MWTRCGLALEVLLAGRSTRVVCGQLMQLGRLTTVDNGVDVHDDVLDVGDTVQNLVLDLLGDGVALEHREA